ncbi:hypothetical protein NPIL_480111, partial [Nephila pilipes]
MASHTQLRVFCGGTGKHAVCGFNAMLRYAMQKWYCSWGNFAFAGQWRWCLKRLAFLCQPYWRAKWSNATA